MLYLLVMLGIAIGGYAITMSTPATTPVTQTAMNESLILPVDMESVRMIEGYAQLSSDIHKLSYEGLFKYAELIIVAEITPDIVTYNEPHVHTLYTAKVIRVIKGSAPEYVDIYQLEGYHPEHQVFVRLNHQPALTAGDRWLFFGRMWTMDDVSHGDVFLISSMCLKLNKDGTLSSVDNDNMFWRKAFQSDRDLSTSEREKLGIAHLPPMYERLHVEGLTLDEFITQWQAHD